MGCVSFEELLKNFRYSVLNELNDFLKSPGSLDICNWDLALLRTQVEGNNFSDTITNYSKIPKFYVGVFSESEDFDGDKVCDSDVNIGKKYIDDYYHKNKDKIDHIIDIKFRGETQKTFNKSRLQFSPHMIQASIHRETWEEHPTFDIGSEIPIFDHWIIFDDLWATENSDLANSILYFASKWDALR